MIKLLGINSEVEGRSFPIDQETILVGRDKTNHIRLNDVSVSTMHCMIITDETTGVYIKDAGSTNGTRINTQDIEEGQLAAGDTLEIGNVLFEVHLADTLTVQQRSAIQLDEQPIEDAQSEDPASEALADQVAPTQEQRQRSLPKIQIPSWAYALLFTVFVLITLFIVGRTVGLLLS